MTELETSGDLDCQSLAEAQFKATAVGCVAIAGDANSVQLDIDAERRDTALAQYAQVLPFVQKFYPLVESERWESRGGNGGLHIVLKCSRPLLPHERIVLQACLGSDPIREMFSLLRMHNAPVSYLFKPVRETV